MSHDDDVTRARRLAEGTLSARIDQLESALRDICMQVSTLMLGFLALSLLATVMLWRLRSVA